MEVEASASTGGSAAFGMDVGASASTTSTPNEREDLLPRIDL
jgi:hypothetical protein